MATRRAPRDRDLLHLTVERLVTDGRIKQPAEMPVYVRTPRRPGEGVGWYWTPAGGRREMLGANSYLAFAQLEHVAGDG
jgi:hypothetical protein